MCRDPDNQYRFTVSAEQCHATAAMAAKQAKESGDDVASRAIAWSAQLQPPKT